MRTLDSDTSTMEGKILLIGNHPVHQQQACAMLKQLGAQVCLTTHAQAAVDQVLHQQPDVILIDMPFPLSDENKTAIAIRQCSGRLKHIPIIALTADEMSDTDRSRLRIDGISDFLSQPFTSTQLQIVLERWLAVSRHDTVEEENTSTQTVIDLTQLNALRKINPSSGDSILKKLITIYLKSSPGFLAQIEDAITTTDRVVLKRAAHTLKSSTANVGATRLAELCKKMETIAETQQITDASAVLSEIQQEFHLVARALETLLQETEHP